MNTVKLHYYSFVLVLLSIPLPMIINNIAIILFVVLSVLQYKKINVPKKAPHLFFPIIFLLSIVSLLYTCDVIKGLKAIEKILPFIIFYLCVNTLSINKKQLHKLLEIFVIWCTILLILCIFIAVYHVVVTNSMTIYNPDNFTNENYFFYHRLLFPLGLHAIYFGMYLAFSAGFLIYYMMRNGKNITKHRVIMLIVLLIGIFLLQSFAVLMAFLLMLLPLFYFNKRISNKIKLISVAVVLVAITFVFSDKAKFDTTSFSYEFENDIHHTNWNSMNIRLAKWDSAMELAKENILIGTGTGCVQQGLNRIYDKNNFDIALNRKFSTHNQYLHYLVELGVVAFILFVLFILFAFYYSISTKNYLLFSLVILMAVVGVTENILTLNKGIVFFACFYYLIIRKNEKT